MRKALPITISFLLLMFSMTHVATAQSVDIPDPNLRSAIAGVLNKPENTPITRVEMEKLTGALRVLNQSITDLTGLEFAVNLKTLFLSDNNISDISPLEDLTNLKTLVLSENQISDITPLQNLANLEALRLIDDTGGFENLRGEKLSMWLEEGTSMPEDEGIDIPDPNLRRAIAEVLKKSVNAPITRAEMEGLTGRLRASNKSITDLAGLEFATNLRQLLLDSNSISDISPLEDLAHLQTLVLSENQISDIAPLRHFRADLITLAIDGNPISDISPLEDLTNLKTLVLSENQISDIASLQNLTNLETLRLIDDTEGFENLRGQELRTWLAQGTSTVGLGSKGTAIEGVSAGDSVDIPDPALRNGIADTLKLPVNTPITQGNMATLTTLWTSGASITDLTGLQFAVNLEALDLSDNGITDVSPLTNLRNLEELDLSDNPITDPTPLIGLRNGGTKITGVTFDDVNPLDRPVPTGGDFDIPVDIPDPIFRLGITNVLGLAEEAPITRGHLTILTSLVVSGRLVTDLTGLEFAVNLEVLDLSKNAITDVSSLAQLGNLTELNLSDNVITDVSALANLEKLRLLDLSDNLIFDVSPLANLKSLTGLNLHNNGITDVSPLANSRYLKGLVLTENPITDETPLDGLRNGGTEVTTLIYDDELLSSLGLWCATPEPPPSADPIPGALGAAGERKHFWQKEDTVYREPSLGGDTVLTVRFMNGTPLQKGKVEHFAPLWAEYAALRFIFTSENRPSDIRVKFEKEGYRSHSVLGTTANEPWNKGKATLVLGAGFGRKNPNYDENHRFNDFNPKLPPSGTIIHEFGHALGLIHEQSNPSATLQDIFDTEQVKRWVTQRRAEKTGLTGEALRKAVNQELCVNYEMIVTQALCRKENTGLDYDIDILERDDWTQTNYTAYDPKSIMLYNGIPLKAGGTTEFNYELSETDKEFIAGLYPDLKPSNIEVKLGSTVNPNPYAVKSRTTVGISVTVLNQNNKPIPKAPVTLASAGATAITFSRNVLNTGDEGTSATAEVTFKGNNASGSLKVTSGNVSKHIPIYVTGIIDYKTEVVDKSVTFRSRKGSSWWKVCSGLEWYWTGPKTLDFSKECEELYDYSVTAEPGSYGWDENGDAPYVHERALENKLHSKHSQYVEWDGKTVGLSTRIREHCVDQTTLYVTVWAKCRVQVTSAAPSLQAQLRPETDALSTLWQELSEIPTETALLPNYPNPFNPETWIPYHLAEPADVTLRIYAADGKLIRTLALGHHPAGVYESKARAAYWDGRNAVGERVASGLYFYTLTTGDFVATGKMLILK